MPDWDGMVGSSGDSGSGDPLRSETIGLVRSARQRLERESDAAVVEGALRGMGTKGGPNGQGQPNLDQTGKVLDVANGLIEMQGKAVTAAQDEATKLKAESGEQYAAGYAEAEDRGHFMIDVLDKSHDAHLETIRENQKIVHEVTDKYDGMVRSLESKLDALIVSQKDAEIARLNAENERLKQRPAQSVAVRTNGQGSRFGDLKQGLHELRELREEIDGIYGPPRTSDPLDDPDKRWRHTAIDDWTEDRKAQRADSSRLTDARIKREESISKAIEGLGPTIEKVIKRGFSGPPERGGYNGMPDRPPSPPSSPPPPAQAQEDEPEPPAGDEADFAPGDEAE